MVRKNKRVDFRCLDCGVDTCESGEFYMLRDSIWSAANPKTKGQLCIKCVEQRINRELGRSDFTFCPLNLRALFTGSERLRDRMGPAVCSAMGWVIWI